MRILIVEGNQTDRGELVTMLESLGYPDVVSLPGGADALRDLGRHGHATSLVIMNLVLPDASGLEIGRKVKLELALPDLPIIYLSDDCGSQCMVSAFEAGGADYIPKPVNIVELGARVRSVLRLMAEIERRRLREKELEALARKLEQMTNVDGLTGVGNRRCMQRVLQREWDRACRAGTPLSLLMVDIDFFKSYNDLYGHLQGDDCLRKIAEAIQISLKRPADLVSRYGGEEFLVLLPETDCRGAIQTAEAIQETIRHLAIPHDDSPLGGQVTVSIGVTAMPASQNRDLVMLIERADNALYQAKSKGRNRIDSVC